MKISSKIIGLLALSLLPGLFKPANAAGFIMVDPAFHGIPGIGRVGVPVGIGRPPVRPITPGRPTTPILRGGVSVGLHLQAQDIKVEITDQVAKTYITQTFTNDSDQNLAGTYLFPLPEDTTFSSFSLHIDGKPVEGKILEASEARSQYEAIVRQMIDPGLLEYADYKTVRARIFPIPAHGTKKVELEYTQLLKAENGLVKYRFPLKGDAEASNGPVDDTKVTVKLTGKQSVRTIWSPSHTVKIERPETHRSKIAFNQSNTLQDKDFLLYYSLSDKDMAANVLTHKVGGEDGYFLLSLSPPMKSNTLAIGKDIVLVADTSGSMQGEKMEQAKKALKYVVTSLAPNDRFGIVPFNTDADSFRSALVPATTDNKRLAVDFIDDLEPRGGTNIGDALKTGASLFKPGEKSERPAYLVMMTDGEPTVGETTEAGILKTITNKEIRLFDFGVGYDVNTRLLNKLSSDNHGTSQFLEPGESLEVALAAFYEKIKAPVLSDVQISYNGVTVKDVYPRQVKDIFAGNQLLLLGRYKGAGSASVNITGKVSGVSKAFSFPLQFAEAEPGSSHLARLWAMRRIGYLTEVAQSNGDTREVIDEIVALSKKHGIITNYTSFLVTDPSENHRLANGITPMPMARPMSSVRSAALDRNAPMLASIGGGGARGGGGTGPAPAPRRPGMAGAGSFAGAAEEGLRDDGVVSDFRRTRQLQVMDQAKSIDKVRLAFKNESYSGKSAVDREKKTAGLKEVSQLSKDERSVKSVEGKTFYQDSNGFWVDSDYKSQPLETITFGSSRYFELSRQTPLLAKYFAVGRQVIVVVGTKAYKVVSAG